MSNRLKILETIITEATFNGNYHWFQQNPSNSGNWQKSLFSDHLIPNPSFTGINQSVSQSKGNTKICFLNTLTKHENGITKLWLNSKIVDKNPVTFVEHDKYKILYYN